MGNKSYFVDENHYWPLHKLFLAPTPLEITIMPQTSKFSTPPSSLFPVPPFSFFSPIVLLSCHQCPSPSPSPPYVPFPSPSSYSYPLPSLLLPFSSNTLAQNPSPLLLPSLLPNTFFWYIFFVYLCSMELRFFCVFW